ncbi:hypothetical protein KZX50_25450, partial [Bacillus infantis]|uniref:hypothetical protein n=1 Tax=Bacillus infantis TaxID=324767 RepID=UPI0020052473
SLSMVLLKKSINNAYLSMQIFRLASKHWHISLHFQVSLMDMGSVPLARFWARGSVPLARLVGQGVCPLGSVLGQGVCPLGSVLGQGVCPLGSLTRGNGMNEQGHINFQNAIIIEKAKRMLTLKSLKMKAFTWIESLNDQYSINSFTGNHAAYFKLDGFADEPEV